MARPRAAGPGRFYELLVHRRRGTYSVSRWDGMAALGWAAPARGGAALWAAFGRRAYRVTGLLRSVGSPARLASDAVMVISHGSVGFGAKKRDSSDPESGLATALSIAVPYPTHWCPHIVEAGVGRVGAGCVYE